MLSVDPISRIPWILGRSKSAQKLGKTRDGRRRRGLFSRSCGRPWTNYVLASIFEDSVLNVTLKLTANKMVSATRAPRRTCTI